MIMPKGQKKYTAEQWAKDRIQYFWERKRTYEATKRSFEDDKFEFNQEMDRYFDVVADEDGKIIIDLRETVRGIKKIICQRISQVKVEFDIDKLRNILTKEQQKKVIQKHYNVINWPALMNLMKDAGINWKEFLKCVDVSETVRENILEQMVELGEVNIEDIKACSNAKIRTQYYKITEK